MLSSRPAILSQKGARLLRKIDEMYYRRVEAVEFAVRYDDGKRPQRDRIG
jgi:regulator of PEP synthase PpsR (kinase-PPPase family)